MVKVVIIHLHSNSPQNELVLILAYMYLLSDGVRFPQRRVAARSSSNILGW